MLRLDNTPHIPPPFCSQIQMSHFILFFSPDKKRGLPLHPTEVSAPVGAVWENLLSRWTGLGVTRGVGRVPRKGKGRGRQGHHAAGPEPLALDQNGQPCLKKKKKKRLEMVLLDFFPYREWLS